MLRRHALVALALAASACTGAEPAAPRPRAVDPLAEERAAAATDPAHLPHASDEGVVLADRAVVSPEGATIAAGGAHLRIALAAFGRGGALTDAADAPPTTEGPEVRIARGPGVTEWWRSLPSGLEQGVTIETRPEGDGPLVLVMSVGDGVHTTAVGDDTDAIALSDAASGRSLGTYAGLVVVDHEGAAVPARMSAVEDRIRIEIEDADAVYPLVVDPLVVSTATILPWGAPAPRHLAPTPSG